MDTGTRRAAVRSWIVLARVRMLTALPYRFWQGLLLDALLPPADGTATAPEPDQIRAFRMAVRNQPGRTSCLRRALALTVLLRERGRGARVVIGVAHGARGLDAHAWVEIDGRVVDDAPDIARRFTPVSGSLDDALTPQLARSIVASP